MQKTLIYIDTNTRSQVYADGSFVTRSNGYVNIERGQWQILCVQFVDRQVDDVGGVTVNDVTFSGDTSFILVADNNFEDEDNLMVKSLQSITPFNEADPLSNMFNIEGDWVDGTTADFSKGQLSIRMNSDTVKFEEALGNKEKITSGIYLSIKQYMQGISNPSTIAWIPFIAVNTIRDWSSAQVNPPTGTEAISFINTYFRNPIERQWSDNGEDWFDSQSLEHDEYYRERIANIGAEWSDKIKVARGGTFTPSVDSSGVLSWTNDIGLENPEPVTIKGDPGPANTLTIGTVTTGEPGTQAAATITGESPNQVLNLTIPRGDKGDPGDGGAGTGDMLKSVYDTNGDGKVNSADEADDALNIGGKTAAQVADAVDKAHEHGNKATIDKLGESDGNLTFNGSPISGGGGTADSVAWENVTGKPSTFPPESHTHEIANVNGLQSALDAKGTVKSVNGVQPDGEGNVTIETGGGGGTVDESRLLPDLATLPAGSEGSVFVVEKAAADANTLRLMHFDSSFYDSITGDTPQASGSVALIEGGKFDKCLQINNDNKSSLKFAELHSSPEQWTIDCWVYLQAYMNKQSVVWLFGNKLNESQTSLLRINSSGIYVEAGYHKPVFQDVGSVPLNEWHHIALTYNGTSYQLFLDGKSLGTKESTQKIAFTRSLWLGSFYNYSSSYTMKGYIDEFRISNVVRWTEDFTPSETAYEGGGYISGVAKPDTLIDDSRLLPEVSTIPDEYAGLPVVITPAASQVTVDASYTLLCPLSENTNDYSQNKLDVTLFNNATLVSDSPNNEGKSLRVVAQSCAYVQLPTPIGTNDFTFYTWVKLDSSGSQTICSTRSGDATASTAFSVNVNSSGQLNFYSNSTKTSTTSGYTAFSFGTWHHIKVVRSSGSIYIFLDGKLHATGTDTNNFSRDIFAIGGGWNGSGVKEGATGNFCDVRLMSIADGTEEFEPVYKVEVYNKRHYTVTDKETTQKALGIQDLIDAHNSDGSAHPSLVKASDLANAGIYSTSSVELNLNFNTALTQGFYFANGANCTNGPFTGAGNNQGWVTVRAIPAGNHALQFFYGFNTDDFFVRRYTGNAWADWKRITTNAAGTPKYSAGVNITTVITQVDGSYTCPSHGWILIKNLAPAMHIYINGEDLSPIGEGSMVPVSANDVITTSGYMQGYSITVLFYPNR